MRREEDGLIFYLESEVCFFMQLDCQVVKQVWRGNGFQGTDTYHRICRSQPILGTTKSFEVSTSGCQN
jgi:hypothetical protein